MRLLGLTLASLALLLTACGGGSDGDGGSDPSSSPSSESSQAEGAPEEGEDAGEAGDAEGSTSDSGDTSGESDDAESEGDASEGGQSTEIPETGDVDDLEDAFMEFSEAIFAGQGDDAYDLLSERCRSELKRDEFVAEADAISKAYGADVEIRIVSSDAQTGRGKVTAKYGDRELDRALTTDLYDWLYEDGDWVHDNC